MAFEAAPDGQHYVFRLFVAGDEQHSRRAQENLKTICDERIAQPCEIEIVDVLESYQLALENKIFLTPALVMMAPSPTVTIFGNLSDTEEVVRSLRLGGRG